MRKNYHIMQENISKIRINKIYLKKSNVEDYSWGDKSELSIFSNKYLWLQILNLSRKN